jgi:hypothetical protein
MPTYSVTTLAPACSECAFGAIVRGGTRRALRHDRQSPCRSVDRSSKRLRPKRCPFAASSKSSSRPPHRRNWASRSESLRREADQQAIVATFTYLPMSPARTSLHNECSRHGASCCGATSICSRARSTPRCGIFAAVALSSNSPYFSSPPIYALLT